MDKHINFINILKKQLNKLVTRKQENISSYQSSAKQLTDLSKIKALMLRENILLGLVINENSFRKSEIYSEVLESGTFNFHIYPLKRKVLEVTKQEHYEEKEIKAHKRSIYPSIQ